MKFVGLTRHYANPEASEQLDEITRDDFNMMSPAAKEKQPQTRLDETQVAVLCEAYKSGETVKSIAARFEVNRCTVYAHLDRKGVLLRRTN